MSDSKLAETVASRGHNLVCIAPPSPSAARAVLAGMLGPDESAEKGLRLALAPAEAVEEWARVAVQVANGSGRRVAGAHTPGRLTRLIKSGTIDLVITSPDTALQVVRRAALKLEEIAGLLLLWPEAWGGAEAGAALLQDLPKGTQRVVVSSDPAASASLIERYCWRAPVTDLLGPPPPDAPPQVRSMPAAWSQRREALLDLVEQLDPEAVAVWVADPADTAGIEQALAAAGVRWSVGSEVPAAPLVIAYDLPSPSMLRQLAAAGDVTLLVPPGTEAYVARMAPKRRPLHALGQLQAAQAGIAQARRTIIELLDQGPAPASFFAIAPLLERHEATAVAAGLYQLWEQAQARGAEASAPVRLGAASVRLWVGAGKRDAVTAHDLVGALLKECGAPKEAIGKVEIRDTFSLIELGGAADAEQIAEKLTGKVIRKRRVVAKVDKGRPGGKR